MILSTLLSSLVIILCYMTGWFVVALLKKRNDLADIAWGPGFILVAWATVLINHAMTIRPLLIATLITLWGLRLAIHISLRNHGKGEDFRYKKWREEWGKWFYVRSYLQVFILQGILLLCVIFPHMVTTSTDITASIGWMDGIGIMVFFVGFLFESIGDYQLSRFLKDKDHGKIMQTGLWAYTRHPNYFGEVSLWWGIFLIALSSPMGWLGVIGPLTITFLILGVSGIPMLEKKYVGNPDYEAYQRQTSPFFPLPRKSEDTPKMSFDKAVK